MHQIHLFPIKGLGFDPGFELFDLDDGDVERAGEAGEVEDSGERHGGGDVFCVVYVSEVKRGGEGEDDGDSAGM